VKSTSSSDEVGGERRHVGLVDQVRDFEIAELSMAPRSALATS